MATRKSARLTSKKLQEDFVLNFDNSTQCNDSFRTKLQVEERKRLQVTQEALQNPLIVHEILCLLKFPDLQTCRLVNRLFNSLSTSLILRRDCAIVKLQYDEDKRVYIQSKILGVSPDLHNLGSKSPPKQLKALNVLLKKSNQFPSTNFVFLCGNIDCSEMKKFFLTNGVHIKSLDLRYITRGMYSQRSRLSKQRGEEPSFTSKSSFRQVLASSVPNLKHLKIVGFDYKWAEEKNIWKNKLKLDSLETFSWDQAKRTALKILQSSPNLKILSDFVDTEDNCEVIFNSDNLGALEWLVQYHDKVIMSLQEKIRKYKEALGPA